MNGLFVGLTTLDIIYLSETVPQSNEKIVALDQVIAAGGPATNAAITFRYCGDRARLLSVIGHHPLSQLIVTDLATYGVESIDLAPDQETSPSVSSIIVTRANGNRAVISLNAVKTQIPPTRIPRDILGASHFRQLPFTDEKASPETGSHRQSLNLKSKIQNPKWDAPDILTDIDLVLIDGHQLAIAEIIAQQAQQKNIPVVLDGGSWKPGLEKVLPHVNYSICSANFYPPNCDNSPAVFSYLQNLGIPHIAITNGGEPIEYYSKGKFGQVAVPLIQTIDTLGAGDIFHGAFCHYILRENFELSLIAAGKIASRACQYFGTRKWLHPEL